MGGHDRFEKAINHLLSEHDCTLLHVGTASTIDGSGDPYHTTIAVLGSLFALCAATGGMHYDIGNDEAATPALTPLIEIDSEAEALWVTALSSAMMQGYFSLSVGLTSDRESFPIEYKKILNAKSPWHSHHGVPLMP